MILTSHAITGATIASMIPTHPIVGFSLGFASHFVLDAIPHWDYSLSSVTTNKENSMNEDMKIDRNAILDFIKLGIDFTFGFACVLFLFGYLYQTPFIISALLGAIGGVLPDALQFVYFKCKREPFISIQRFHKWAHASRELKERSILGILSQVAVISLVLMIHKIFTIL